MNLRIGLAAAVLAALLHAPARAADAPHEAARALKDARIGSMYLELRPRYEVADEAGLERSARLSLRSAVGVATRPYRGISLLAEGESVVVARRGLAFDTIGRPNGRTTVGDPADTSLNQLYVDLQHPWARSGIRVGRQRLALDDQRFVGSAAARQNDMTMDAAVLEADLGLPDLRAFYAYVERVQRPFGDQGGSATRDFESSSHLLRVAYARSSLLSLKLFSYWIDLRSAPSFSSRSVGLRLEGSRELSPRRSVAYAFTLARQSDHADNPVSYDAVYLALRASLRDGALGTLTLGFERLGSDRGKAVFSTPLATLQTFNGQASVFSDNGGREGLRDWMLELEPELPARLRGRATLHRFTSDRSSRSLGWELDVALSRPVHPLVTLELVGACYRARSDVRASRLRAWIQASLHF